MVYFFCLPVVILVGPLLVDAGVMVVFFTPDSAAVIAISIVVIVSVGYTSTVYA